MESSQDLLKTVVSELQDAGYRYSAAIDGKSSTQIHKIELSDTLSLEIRELYRDDKDQLLISLRNNFKVNHTAVYYGSSIYLKGPNFELFNVGPCQGKNITFSSRNSNIEKLQIDGLKITKKSNWANYLAEYDYINLLEVDLLQYTDNRTVLSSFWRHDFVETYSRLLF